MRAARIVVIACAGAMLVAGSVQAQLQREQPREPHPGAAALAAAGNILFMPIRFALTTVGAELGGLTGWLTAGNVNAAHDIWRLPPFDGQTYLQPEMMYGEEPLDIGTLEYRMHVTPP